MSDIGENLDGYQDAFQELTSFWGRIDDVESAIDELLETALTFTEGPLESVLEKIKAFEPSVSVIGQIKAGKSTLMNAMLGETGLLPSDVNPWTSVITALHLNSRHRPLNTKAVFRFFDQGEWERLVATGGRLGEMANRSGFEDEAEEIREQVSQMRETTQGRLGDEFDKLLGSSRAFPELDPDTINRYICYGDPDEMAEGANEGVYADITKTADLYLDRPHLPKGLCLRDTPGVNDTFMMREQITLNAISDSRVVVVVLSAHQALSTMDVALLRIICAIEAREVLIYVNRIDELEDPAGEQVKIKASIEKVLDRLGVGQAIEIMFGSGYWANFALSGATEMLPKSRAALARMYDGDETDDLEVLRARAMEASGVPALLKAIAHRVIEGPGLSFLRDIENELNSIIEMSETVEAVAESGGSAANVSLTPAELQFKLGDMRVRALKDFDDRARDVGEALRERLRRAQDTFVDGAVTSLQAQIDTFGEAGNWNHDPSSLRMMMKTAFVSSCAKLRREGEVAFDIVLDGVQDILENDMGVFREGSAIEFPEQVQHKAPTVLARTLSLDLETSWWGRKFGRKNAAEKRYRAAITAETEPLIDDLVTGFFEPAVLATRDIVEQFAHDQGAFCQAILEHADRTEKKETAKKGIPGFLKRLTA